MCGFERGYEQKCEWGAKAGAKAGLNEVVSMGVAVRSRKSAGVTVRKKIDTSGGLSESAGVMRV